MSQLCFMYAPANFHLPLFLLLPSVLCLPITRTSSLICSQGLCVVPTVMVQLFNVPKIALIEEQHLLEKFILVFKRVLEICFVRGTATVDVKHEAIRQKVYLRPQGDLRLIVSHPHVAVYVLSERLDVFETILQVVAYLQWMNPYSKNSLVDFENDDAWTFAIQLEVCSFHSF
jgi:hypothetical protein